MPAYKDESGTWHVQCYYKDAAGHNRHKVKRGFATELDAQLWERDFLADKGSAMDMEFRRFVKVYEEDMRPRLRESTWINKEHMIRTKIEPFFGLMLMNEIAPVDIVKWQNQMRKHVGADGEAYKPTYLRTVNNQLNAIFNHAERFYGLKDNPVRRVLITVNSLQHSGVHRYIVPRFADTWRFAISRCEGGARRRPSGFSVLPGPTRCACAWIRRPRCG